MDEFSIINCIKENKLMYLNIDRLTKALLKHFSCNEKDLKNTIKSLIENGTLFENERGISVSADHGFFKSVVSVTKKGFGFAYIEGQDDAFIPQFALNNAINGDECLIEITSKRNGANIEAKVVKILKRNTDEVVGTFIQGKSKNVVYPDDIRFPQIRIYKSDVGNAKHNDKVLVKINYETEKDNLIRGEVCEVLGQANTPQAEQLSIIRSYKLTDKFEENVIKEAKQINQNVDIKKYAKRKDYTAHKVITIDGEDARDFDDALSVEKTKNGYKLFVHIADVSNYVVANSALDKSAFERGTSAYFPNMVIPMLPKELSNGVCSLSENNNRLTLTVEICLDENCEVVSSQIFEGIIKSSHRMTYTQVQKIIEGDKFLIDEYADIYDDLLAYQQISNKLKEKRVARGEINMNLPEPFILEDSSGQIVSIENRVQDEAHQIIESLMILTNECVAKTFCELDIPFVYRVHEKPDEMKVQQLSKLLNVLGINNKLLTEGDKPITYQKIIDEIKDTPKEKIITMLVLRTMMKAQYQPACLGHFGLASEFYCHFTSPIRRYPDLLIHRIIKEYLHGKSKQDLMLTYKDFVESASVQSSNTERNADEAEREVDDYKKAVFMTQFIGQEFEGVVSTVKEFGMFVELENGVEGLVKLENLPDDFYSFDQETMSLNGSYHKYCIGDEVKIIVANTNPQMKQIDFVMAESPKKFEQFVVKKNKNAKKSSKKSTKTKKTKKSNKNKKKNRR